MNLMHILRFIRGYVIFEVKGGFIERFINLCAANKVHIWSVKPNSNSLTACILIKNFIRLKPIIKKTGSRIKILQKRGIPVFLRKNRARIGLLLSMLFFTLFFIIMNQFVWIIEVTGTNTVSHEEIINYTEQLGLESGSLVSLLDTEEISRQAVNYFNGRLMWMAINIKGSKAVIEVRDYIDEHEDTQFKDPCNLIADFDGTILSVEVFNGDQEVWAGNAVKKGDLLISGVIENRDLSCVYYEARGRITAVHDIIDTSSYPVSESSYNTIADSERVYSLSFFGLDIPLGAGKNDYGLKYESDKYLSYQDYKLPFGIVKNTYCSKNENKYKTNAELLFALDEYTSKYYDNYKNTNIISCESKLQNDGDNFNIQSNLRCIDYIGIQSPIYTEIYEN